MFHVNKKFGMADEIVPLKVKWSVPNVKQITKHPIKMKREINLSLCQNLDTVIATISN